MSNVLNKYSLIRFFKPWRGMVCIVHPFKCLLKKLYITRISTPPPPPSFWILLYAPGLMMDCHYRKCVYEPALQIVWLFSDFQPFFFGLVSKCSMQGLLSIIGRVTSSLYEPSIPSVGWLVGLSVGRSIYHNFSKRQVSSLHSQRAYGTSGKISLIFLKTP